MSKKPYTKKMLEEFDQLTMDQSSLNGHTRIMARLSLRAFVATHGKDVCDQMFAELKEREGMKA